MSTVIIGGGSKARKAIDLIEQASLTASDPQRAAATDLLHQFLLNANTWLSSVGADGVSLS